MLESDSVTLEARVTEASEAISPSANPAIPDSLTEGVWTTPIVRHTADAHKELDDQLAVEEPLEVRILADGFQFRAAVTMRTPGHDFELAVGFLLSEGLVPGPGTVARVFRPEDPHEPQPENVVIVELKSGTPFHPKRLSRNVFTSSSCGVCGKNSLDSVWEVCPARPGGLDALSPDLLRSLPDRLREVQAVFTQTGGLHAAALFDESGKLLLLREDVGRHNAVDKINGRLLLDDQLPASGRLLLVSGRASFELVQKAVIGGIPALAAVGAPSSLAVMVAREFGMTLVGFLSPKRFNAYSGAERLR
ncbi:MAG: formate dehydrogenase accessory sulfurtransferase FdhD [SAR324 cluster bacterium]|nr:formate dehydrogenase accessory sulfurtransferase FdhD [SAR324 cluster bacterium]